MGCISTAAFAGMLPLFGCSPKPEHIEPSDKKAVTTEESEQEMQAAPAENQIGEIEATSQVESTAGDATTVVYFSCTGNTESIAEKIAAAADATLLRIEPAEPYSPADLDYNSDCRANAEQDSGSARPAMAEPAPDISGYNTIYLGYPIWWGKVPRIILTFLENTDLAGKTIIPFCTSGSSPISGSIAEITQAAPDASVLEGKRFSAGATQQEIASWVDGLRLR